MMDSPQMMDVCWNYHEDAHISVYFWIDWHLFQVVGLVRVLQMRLQTWNDVLWLVPDRQILIVVKLFLDETIRIQDVNLPNPSG